MLPSRRILLGLMLLISSAASLASAQQVSKFETNFKTDLIAGERLLQTHLEANRNDQEAQFALGVMRVLLASRYYFDTSLRYDKPLRDEARMLGLPIAIAEAQATREDILKLIVEVAERIKLADETLAAVTSDDVKLRLRPANLNARFLQAYSELETFSSTDSAERQLNHGFGLHRQTVAEQPGIVTFDIADAIYLRSRCQQHLGECELALAYADPELCFFTQIRSFEFPPEETIIKLHELQRDPAFAGEEELNQRIVAGLVPASYLRDWIDKFAALHTFKQELVAPERMPRALKHFQAAVDLELQAIDAVRAEKDDDCEWRPNAQQKHCVIYHPRRPGRESGRPRNPSRRAELVELQSLLTGKTLLPHHRFSATVGINLTKIFNEPASFDAILWHHGSGAANYLEKGELTAWQPDFTLHHDDFFFRRWMNAATRAGGQW